MASGPKWNAQRGFWYAQFWDGKKTTRRKVAEGPNGWKPGDPPPRKVPSEAYSGFLHWEGVEKQAREKGGNRLPTSLPKFLEAHVAIYHSPGTRRMIQVAVRRFLAWCDEQGITRFDQVTTARCDEWMEYMATHPSDPSKPGSRPPSAATLETKRGYLGAAWGRLVDRKLIATSPWSGVKNYGEEREKPKKAWTPAQFRRLLEASEDWLKDILVFGVNTGLRIGSMSQILWTDWVRPEPEDRHFGYLNIRQEITKTYGYKVPVSGQLHDLLCRRFGKHDKQFIMTAKMGKPIASRSQTADGIIAACAAARLPFPESPNHHMRRTFGRWAVFGQLNGVKVPVYIVSKWMGHSTVDQTMEYLDLELEDSFTFMVPESAATGDSSTPPPATSASA